MDWVGRARGLFACEKPPHFTDYRHCAECAEHDAVLLASDVDRIGLVQLGNPAWDPLCVCSSRGKQYYMPALVRLVLETLHEDAYLEQFLFHLIGTGQGNALFMSCSAEQRQFIAAFIAYLVDQRSDQVERLFCVDEALHAYQIWSQG